MGSKNRSAARFSICSGSRADSRAGGSGGWKAAGTNEERKRRAGVHFPGRHLLLASCRSGTRFSGGARRASSSLVPRLAPRGFPGRQEWRVESGGDERGAKKEGGGLFSGRHPLSWRRAPVGRGMQKGTGTGHGRRCALASARMTGRGILPHVDQVPGSAGMVGRERDAKKGTAKGMGGGVRWRAHGATGRASSPHVDRAPGSARGGGARKGRGAGRPG